MPQTLKKLFVAATLAAAAFASGAWHATDSTTPAVVAAEPKPPQLFELRIYTAAPGKLDALHRRFRDHTLGFFEKHGIRNVGYWTGVDEGQREKLYYLVAYRDRDDRERRLMNGIAKDPEFLRAVAESERDGKLTVAIESVLLNPTDYSPMR